MRSHPTNTYTVAQNNNYPTGVPVVGIVSTLFWATLTDFMGGKRYLVGYWIGITGIVTSALILAYPQNTTIHFAMYYWAGSVYACQATFFAWANDVLRYEEDNAPPGVDGVASHVHTCYDHSTQTVFFVA